MSSEAKIKLLTTALQRAATINNVAMAAQANKKSCMAMNHRIQIANEFIKAAYHRTKEAPLKTPPLAISDIALNNYCALLDRMKEFLIVMCKRKPMSKLFYALRFRDEFDAHMREFDVAVLELNLGIALRTEAQLDSDRDALEEDMSELKGFRKELQNGIDNLGGQLAMIRQMIARNQPMEDILAAVEIDFRDVVEINPPETRRGRTFPVHKRSWLAQEVAEKPLGYFGSNDMLDMLKNEVAILKKLDRCNYIVKFMGVTNRNSNMSIIMEWLPGGDLATALANGIFDWEQKLFVAADIARGLLFLHEVGIIHKNLRAKNVVLTRFNQAKISNFRQSRLENAATRPMSDPFSFVRWLAPEKMMPKETRYGPECDIYSFGMLLFEIASNHIPFPTYRDRELPELIVLKEMYETIPEGTPTEYANIMSACWSHDGKLRPTVSQVLLILRDACHRVPNGQSTFGGLAANLNNPAPLFAIAPPTPATQSSEILPISPPMTPVRQNGLLTPEIWNNPYVNKRHVEDKMEQMRAEQLQQQQQQQQQQQGQPSQGSQSPISSHRNKRRSTPQSQPLSQPQSQSPVQSPAQSPRSLRLPHQLAVPTIAVVSERSLPNPGSPPAFVPPPPPSIEISETSEATLATTTTTSTSKMGVPSSSSPKLYKVPIPEGSPVKERPAEKEEYVSMSVEAIPVIVEKMAGSPVMAMAAATAATTTSTTTTMMMTATTATTTTTTTAAAMVTTPPVIPTSTKPLGLKVRKLKKPLDEQVNEMSLQEAQPNPPSPVVASATTTTATTAIGSSGGRVPMEAGLSPQQQHRQLRQQNSAQSQQQQQQQQQPQPQPQQQQEDLPVRRSSVESLIQDQGPPEGFTMAAALHLHENSERERAWRVFKYYADRNDPEGVYWTAYYKFHGEGGQTMERKVAFDQFRRLAEMEPSASPTLKSLLSNAHFYTAVCFLEGQGVSRSQSTGFKHMEKAADLGNAFAQYLIGDAYSKGTSGVIKSLEKRNMYWQAAAQQREPRAMEQCRRHGIAF
ncbi:hypothetical protein DFQ27_005509 [Actinomortierella ambigua]|uniref:Protein kinase domain-containing protein n=1 Tax=Actinomortierella ambigua TaxID=1343610 RepID=A0A9P6PYM8_9FUNG|nr:hypothetical protein DFQ27_005509 [Actinomortierella ambigua]